MRGFNKLAGPPATHRTFILIPVRICCHGVRLGPSGTAQGGRVGTLSVLRFIPMGVFDGATIRTIGKAFDAACKELRDGGQPAVVHEVMIKRIIAAAEKANAM